MVMSAAWTNLLEIIGLICDTLLVERPPRLWPPDISLTCYLPYRNGVHTPRHHMNSIDQRLRHWHSMLDPSIQYNPKQTPAVFLLQ